MTTFMRSAAVAAVTLFVAFVTLGCDDVGGGGGGGGTTTTLGATTTTLGGATTTSSTGSTVSTTTVPVVTTTTTGSITTTTTGGGNQQECDVTFALTNAVTVGALQYDTDYSSAGGEFVGSGDLVECGTGRCQGDTSSTNLCLSNSNCAPVVCSNNLAACTTNADCTAPATCRGNCVNVLPAVNGVIVQPNDDESAGGGEPNKCPGSPAGTPCLSVGIISLSGVSGPGDILTCLLRTTPGNATAPQESDFAVTVVDATDPDLNPVTANVGVSALACQLIGGPTTTTTVATPTTSTTTTTVGGGASQFDVVFSVTDTATIGALQWNVDYSTAPGGFPGTSDTVECGTGRCQADTSSTNLCLNNANCSPAVCSNNLAACTTNADCTAPATCRGNCVNIHPAVNGAIVSVNDDDTGPGLLTTGIISLAGVSTPGDMLTCLFQSTDGAPQASNFAIEVTDAADPDLNPISPPPSVVVQSITPK